MKFIASRSDGLCSRLGAIFNAMYLAKITNNEFKFFWPKSENQMSNWEKTRRGYNFRSIECDLATSIFSKEFNSNFYLGDTVTIPGLPFGLKIPFQSYKVSLEDFMSEDLVYISHIPCYNYIENIDKEDYYKNMQLFWKENIFSSKIEKIIEQATNKAKKLNNFVTIHVRVADVALNEEYKNTGFFVYKFCPLELVAEIVDEELKNKNNIFLVSDDSDAIRILKDYYKNNKNSIFLIDEFLSDISLENETQRAFFEIALMTCSLKVYTGDSNFSKFASRVGLGKEAIYISELFSNQQRFEIIKKNIDKFKLKPLQDAYKFLYLYTRGKLIKKSWSELEQIAKKALELDSDNHLYRCCILECLIQQNKLDDAEKLMKLIKDNFYSDFIKDLLHRNNILKESLSKLLLKIDIRYKNLAFLSLLINQNSDFGATLRIKNHLAYKLGQVTIKNSKTIKGYIKLPFMLI
ncbi:sugar transferase, partial [Campylobacter jejuni]